VISFSKREWVHRKTRQVTSSPRSGGICFLFKLSHFLTLLLLYDNPSSSSTSPLGTSQSIPEPRLPVGVFQPLEQVREPTVNEFKEPQILTGLYTFVSGYVYGRA